MEKTIKNTAYQMGSGALIATVMDSILPTTQGINSAAQAIQVFIEIGAQVAGTIILSDALARTFGTNLGSGAMDMIPSMMAMMGFQPNLMAKMSLFKSYLFQSYSGFQLIQTTHIPKVGMREQGAQSEQTNVVPSDSDNNGQSHLLDYSN